jgi:hypothetical protein
MNARNDDVINQEAVGEEFILSASATLMRFRLSLLILGVPQKTRWQAQQEGGREGSVEELDVKDGGGRSESMADADRSPCAKPPRQSIAWSYSSEQL